MFRALGKSLSRRGRFEHIEPGRLVDGEIELVEPHAMWIDDFLEAVAHPETARLEPLAADQTTREHLLNFVDGCPRGRHPGNMTRGIVPSYHFWIRWNSPDAAIRIAGAINLRVGNTIDLVMYLGHMGYNVFPAARGRHFAERAARLVIPIAQAHGMPLLWITTNPDNLASRRTIERLGAQFVETVSLPSDHPLQSRGETEKCRYRLFI